MVDEMKDLDGLMSENSVKATIYSYWHFFFYRKLMIEYTTKGNTEYAKSSAENIDKDRDAAILDWRQKNYPDG